MCIYTYTYICMYICICIHTHIYICIYIYYIYKYVSEGMYDNTQDKSHSTYVLYLKIFTL